MSRIEFVVILKGLIAITVPIFWVVLLVPLTIFLFIVRPLKT